MFCYLMSGLTSLQILWVLGWFCESTFVHQGLLVPVSPCVNTVQGWSWLPHVHAVLKLVRCPGTGLAREQGTEAPSPVWAVEYLDLIEWKRKKLQKKGRKVALGPLWVARKAVMGRQQIDHPALFQLFPLNVFGY